MRKAVNKPKRHTDLRASTLANLAAKKKLRAARAAGDADAIAAALAESESAAAAVRDVHTGRFEKIAAMRGTTALNAMSDLSKLARQQRYAVTDGQAAAIVGPLTDGLAELREALNEGQRRNTDKPARAISFSNGTDRVRAH